MRWIERRLGDRVEHQHRRQDDPEDDGHGGQAAHDRDDRRRCAEGGPVQGAREVLVPACQPEAGAGDRGLERAIGDERRGPARRQGRSLRDSQDAAVHRARRRPVRNRLHGCVSLQCRQPAPRHDPLAGARLAGGRAHRDDHEGDTPMTDRAMSRRAFLARSGAVAGGAVLAGSGLVEASRVLAGAPDSTWVEPAVRSSRNGVLSTRFLVAEADVPIAKKPARSLVYEGTYPGPTLEVNAGDRLHVDFVNHSKQPTNLHTHGLHVSPKPPSDDVLLDITPGKAYRYRYDLPADHPGGAFWYHAHLHMYTDNQVFGGQFG